MPGQTTPDPTAPPSNKDNKKWTSERVLSIRHWTPTLISLRTTRYRDFSFVAGQYTRIGFLMDAKMVWRPYSMVSPTADDFLEFLITLAPEGQCSKQFGRLQIGDEIQIDKSSFGFLTTQQLAPGRDLWVVASGTGLGPFLSILHEAALWQTFERIVVVHSVRYAVELAYREEIAALPHKLPLAGARLCYLPIVTREPGASLLAERIPLLLTNGQLEEAAGVPIHVENARVMVCGNPQMASDMRQILGARGFLTSRGGVPGQMVFEKYW